MLVRFYVLPIWTVVLGTIGVIIISAFVKSLLTHKKISRKIENSIYAFTIFLSLFLIINATIIGRPSDIFTLRLIPFQSFIDAKTQPETYRTMLMNVVLFVPFGITFCCYSSKRFLTMKSVFISCAFSLLLSAFIEISQYIFGMGLCQIDDIICNVFGAFLGSLCLCLSELINQQIIKK